MSLKQGNKKIVTDGLVMCLDAANPKSFGPTEVEYLIVAGGGSGGEDIGGGGGAGGFLTGFTTIDTDTAYTITVGAGGLKGRTTGEYGGYGRNGENSSALGLTAIGGGAGGGESTEDPADPDSGRNGRDGGSGGGAGYRGILGGSSTTGQGNDGGVAYTSYGMAGGGGAGSAGEDGTATSSGNGGKGKFSDIDGNNYYYAAGGGGGGWSAADTFAHGGDGGFGGGGGAGGIYNDWRNPGAGGGYARNSGSAGQATTGHGGDAGANTGSGGGAAGESNGTHNSLSGNGGSGIVIIKYKGSQKATGGTVTSVKGHTVHTFTSSGTFTTGARWIDIVDNSNYGTNSNTTYSSNNLGCLSFNGSSSKSVSSYKPSSARSFFYWVKYNTFTGTNGFQLMGTQEAGAYTYIGIMDSGNLYYAAGTNGGDIGISVGSIDTWVNIGLVINSDGYRYIYKNGISVYDTTGLVGNVPTTDFYIGCVANNHWVNGFISNVSCYNRALTADEVLQNFNVHRGRFGL